MRRVCTRAFEGEISKKILFIIICSNGLENIGNFERTSGF